MKLSNLIAAGFIVAGAFAAQSSAQVRGGNINARERHQQRRIAQGIRNGSLTPAEAARLEQNEAEVRRLEARLRDNGLSRWERARIEHRLNELNRQIYRQKHDSQHGYRG